MSNTSSISERLMSDPGPGPQPTPPPEPQPATPPEIEPTIPPDTPIPNIV